MMQLLDSCSRVFVRLVARSSLNLGMILVHSCYIPWKVLLFMLLPFIGVIHAYNLVIEPAL
jgi:hypothetical protein